MLKTLDLRYLRRAAGLTQEELAVRCRVKRLTIIRWEKRETIPSSEHVYRLARALGVPSNIVLDALN